MYTNNNNRGWELSAGYWRKQHVLRSLIPDTSQNVSKPTREHRQTWIDDRNCDKCQQKPILV